MLFTLQSIRNRGVLMAAKGDDEIQIPAVLAEMHRYVPVIHGMMDEQGMKLRDLACRSQISRSRLGRILHRQPEKRVVMQLPEFLSILHALGVQMGHAWIGAKRLETIEMVQEEDSIDYSDFLVAFNEAMPEMVKNHPALARVKFRKEWSRPLAKIVLDRVAQVELERQRRERELYGREED